MKAARSIQKAPVRILAEAALKPETAWVAALAAAQEGAEAGDGRRFWLQRCGFRVRPF